MMWCGIICAIDGTKLHTLDSGYNTVSRLCAEDLISLGFDHTSTPQSQQTCTTVRSTLDRDFLSNSTREAVGCIAKNDFLYIYIRHNRQCLQLYAVPCCLYRYLGLFCRIFSSISNFFDGTLQGSTRDHERHASLACPFVFNMLLHVL